MRVFLVVTFGFSWALWAVLWALGPGVHPGVRTAVMVGSMFGPALGAVAAQRAQGEAVLAPLGVALRPNRWWLLAWLLPAALQPVILVGALLLPGTSWSPDLSGFLERLALSLPPEQVQQAKAQLDALPRSLFWALTLAQPLVAGATVNALAAFGEELGWRGWLFRRYATLGFWRRNAVVGALWGAWHAPIILQGHNYPQHPAAGVALMTLFCLLLAPLADVVRLRGGSVWAAAVLHGSVNATAGLGLLFVRGGDDLTVGMTGIAGLVVLALVDLGLWGVDRRRGGALLAGPREG